MDQVEAASKSLPLYALGGAVAFASILLALLLSKTRSPAAKFLMFAIWIRLVLQALHEFSYSPSPLGLSWSALVSVCIILMSGFVLRRRGLSDAVLIPVYLMVIVMAVSGILNNQIGLMVTGITKYAYFAVLILAVRDALEDLGPHRLLRLLLVPFMIPVVLQLLSLVLGVAAGENERSTSYIGGFNHESVFSVCLMGGLLVVSLAPITTRLRLVLVAYALVAMVAANYRTAILAAVPIVAITLLSDFGRRTVSAHRPLVVLLGIFVVSTAIGVGAFVGQERFADFGAAASGGTDLLKSSTDYTPADKRILSGRPYMLAMYLEAWWAGDPAQKLIGFGPESWTLEFRTYAHNTLASALYEIGLIGFFAMLFLWLWMLRIALLTPAGVRLRLVGAHASFFVLNMSTMPMWQIEGMIFYSILCGLGTYYAVRRSSDAPLAWAPIRRPQRPQGAEPFGAQAGHYPAE